MKKVLVLSGDCYVGRHVVQAFHQSQEYDVEITRSKSDSRRAATTRATAMADAHGWLWNDTKDGDGGPQAPPSPDNASSAPHGRRKKSRTTTTTTTNNNNNNSAHTTSSPLPVSAGGTLSRQQLQREAEERASLPADIRPCVRGIAPKHNDDTEAFRKRLLSSDVVVAVLEEDAYEATCAIRILESTHYEVEKTFVLVSSAVTWAYTLEAERARARLTRQRERAEARDTFLEEMLDEEAEARGEGEDGERESAAAAAVRVARRAARRHELEQRLPPSLRDPLPGEDDEEIRELVPDRVFTEDGYAQRVPHPRFQHWHALEHRVKRANTQTLHTYVVFAGLPYGAGEGESALYGLLRRAWYHQPLLQYGPGTNAIPMIHVQDLAAILFRLGNSYDTLEERYVFAVDQGKVTQRQLLHAVQAKLGGTVEPATSGQYHLLSVATPVMARANTRATAAASVSSGGVGGSNGALVSSGSNSIPPSGTGPNASVSTLSHPAGGGAAAAGTGSSSSTAAAAPSTAFTASTISADLVKLDRLELPPPSTSQELFRVFGNTPCWGDGNALLSTFILSDVRAEPAAVLNFYPAEEWVALDGFTACLDLVLAQFREAHSCAFRPVRALITGPPLSGVESLAVLMGRQCHTSVLTLPTVVRDYTQHVAAVREALRRLLVRRLARRRARVQARLVLQAAEAKRALRAARAERRKEQAAAKATKKAKRGSREGDEDEDAAGERDAENEEEDGGVKGEDGEEEEEEDASTEDSLNASISIFIPKSAAKTSKSEDAKEEEEDDEDANAADADDEDGERNSRPHSGDGRSHHVKRAPVRSAEEVVDEAYIRGAAAMAHNGGSDDADLDDAIGAEGGGLDEEQEEVMEGQDDGGAASTWLEQLEGHDDERQAELLEGQELLPESAAGGSTADTAEEGSAAFQMPRFAARRRGRAFARDVDRQELRCITALRREYLLGLKVLALKVSRRDGRLPRPPPPPAESGEENDDEEEAEKAAGRAGNTHGGKGRPQRSSEREEAEGGDGDRSESGSNDAAGANRDDAATASEEEEEEPEESNSSATGEENGGNAADETTDAAGPDAEAGTFLDAALAFMLRWRLRQSDCRCQGYVLGNFPQTLSQAVLCFRANEAELEDAELRRQRVLAPLLTRLDDHENTVGGGGAAAEADGDDDATPLPPPVDEDFPLPDVANMEEPQLRALERAHRRARGALGTATATEANAHASLHGDEQEEEEEVGALEPEEIMAPVDEALFVEHVVSLQANPTLLRSTVEALETSLTATVSSETAAPPSPQLDDEARALRELRRLLSAAPYTRQLDEYLQHHAPTAPPTQSLLAWLRAVTTTPALGVRPAPVIVPLSSDGGAGAGNAADGAAGGDVDGAGGVTTTLDAPSTSRTAEIVTLPAPVLSVPQVKANWCAAYAASHPRSCPPMVHGTRDEGTAVLAEKLPMALLRLAPLFWTGDAAAVEASPFIPSSSSSRQHKRQLDVHPAGAAKGAGVVVPPSLTELQRGLCARLVPQRRLAACGVDGDRNSSSSGGGGGGGSQMMLPSVSSPSIATAATLPSQSHASGAFSSHHGIGGSGGGAGEMMNSLSTITRERMQLTELEKREVQLADLATREGEAQVLQERTVLRKLQLAEESRGAAALAQMPAETYLMKYVLPSLTPAMTEVVRTRSDDPVTALANVLFDYHRRTTI